MKFPLKNGPWRQTDAKSEQIVTGKRRTYYFRVKREHHKAERGMCKPNQEQEANLTTYA